MHAVGMGAADTFAMAGSATCSMSPQKQAQQEEPDAVTIRRSAGSN